MEGICLSSPGYYGLFGTLRAAELARKPKRVYRLVEEPTPVEENPQPSQQEICVYRALTEYFGGDARKAIDFMRCHAGATMIVPTMQIIEKLALDWQIIREISRDPSVGTASRLASIHNIQRRAISKTLKRETGIGMDERRERQHCRHPRLSRNFRIRV